MRITNTLIFNCKGHELASGAGSQASETNCCVARSDTTYTAWRVTFEFIPMALCPIRSPEMGNLAASAVRRNGTFASADLVSPAPFRRDKSIHSRVELSKDGRQITIPLIHHCPLADLQDLTTIFSALIPEDKSRWVIFNHQQWTGDYLSAGVTSIAMDLLEPGSDHAFQFAIGPAAGFSQRIEHPWFCEQHAVCNSGRWPVAPRRFYLVPSAMTYVPSSPEPSTFADVLSEVSELRLFVNAGATPTSVIGDDGTNAKIGLDNIQAIAAPVAGDFDLNGVRNALDIPAMLAALTDLNLYKSAHQLDAAGLLAVGDVNADGKVNNADMQAF